MPSREQVLDRSQARTETAEERAARQMAAAYNQARREILARLLEGWTGAELTPDAAASFLRQSGLLQQVDARLQQLEREVGITLRGIVDDSTDRALTAIQSELALLPPSLRPNELNLFGTINTRMVEQFVPVAMADWRGLTTSMSTNLQRELQVGLIQGESFPMLSRRLLGQSPGEGAVFPRAQTSADLATRRLVIQSENTAKQAAIAEVAQSIPEIGKQAIAAVGKNTTDCCLRVHGQIKPVSAPFELVGEPRFADQLMTSPFHWNCRTAIAMHHPFFEEAMPTDKLKADAQRELKRRAEEKKEKKSKSVSETVAASPELLAARETTRRAEQARAEAEAARVAAEAKRAEAEQAAAVAEQRRQAAESAAAAALKSDIGDIIDEGAPVIPDLDQLTFVKELGGSTGAKLYQDADGKRYVVKGGDSEAHIRSEALADQLYMDMGANVPAFRLQEKDGKTYKVAEFIDGKLLLNLRGAELEAARVELQKHFAADVLLRNWDVVGMGDDNVLVDKDGKVWRIDNGGSLNFRAQGAPKQPSEQLGEIWTLRNPKMNSSTAAVFGDMPYGDIMRQMEALAGTEATVLAKISDPALREMMAGRYAEAKKLSSLYNTMSEDKFADKYIDRMAYAQTWIRESGIMDTAAPELTWRKGTKIVMGTRGVILEDENGKAFDDLRGDNGIYAKFLKELAKRSGGDASKFLEYWVEEQSGSSWSGPSVLVKQRIIGKYRPGDYYYPDQVNLPMYQALLDQLATRYPEEVVLDAVTSLHALTYENFQVTKMGRPGATPGTLQLIRTEDDGVREKYWKKRGATVVPQRGPLESTSLFQPISIYGDNKTVQDVPYHRIIGFYGFGRDKTIFLADFENELLAILEKIPSTYVGKAKDPEDGDEDEQ